MCAVSILKLVDDIGSWVGRRKINVRVFIWVIMYDWLRFTFLTQMQRWILYWFSLSAIKCRTNKTTCLGGSPGLGVMGDNSYSRGRGFESWCCILDGHFHIYLLKRKEAGVGPFLKNKHVSVVRKKQSKFSSLKYFLIYDATLDKQISHKSTRHT